MWTMYFKLSYLHFLSNMTISWLLVFKQESEHLMFSSIFKCDVYSMIQILARTGVCCWVFPFLPIQAFPKTANYQEWVHQSRFAVFYLPLCSPLFPFRGSLGWNEGFISDRLIKKSKEGDREMRAKVSLSANFPLNSLVSSCSPKWSHIL